MEEKKTLTLKEWANADKPREKMLNLGKKSLTDAELIAILLRTGVRGKSAVDLAKEVLALGGNSLTTLSRLDISMFRSVKGMALAKAATLMAALETGWRMQSEIASEQEVVIKDSQTTFRYMMSLLADLDHEEFWAIFLNNRKKVLSRQRIAMGGQTETSVDIRVLFRTALEAKAVSMIVAHNHPSGSMQPSNADRKLTKRIDEAGRLLGIHLVDHIIVGIAPGEKASYYSFADEGLL